MKLTIKENSKNYPCSVVKIGEIYPIKDADRIKRTVIYNNDIIIDTSIKEGDVMLYFVSGTKLNEDFCKWNNLLTDATLNKDGKSGYISAKKLLLKAVKLRGIVSDGLLLPLSSLSNFVENVNDLKIGDEFTDIDEFSLCEKYIVPENTHSKNPQNHSTKKEKLTDLIVEKQFRFHSETSHFAKNLHKFESGDRMIITRKRHGSSGIISNVLTIKKLNFFENILSKFGVNISKQEYGYIWSSGKPKSNIPKGLENSTHEWKTSNQSFYKEDIWKRAYNTLKNKCEKGITLYFEITGEGIQGQDYTYGKEYDIHVYRITSTNIDGCVYEFGWNEVKNYCNKYEINFCEEYEELQFPTNGQDVLEYLSKTYLNKSYSDCKVDEGICIRHVKTNEIFKLKSPNFLLKEQKSLEEGVETMEE